ncbi:MAG: YiiX family permuted papain-like enzyme [Verrucomicrobiales bacterium]|nr:YiiX family permuted papain-like enzyme [Verrucomicrobiales bacterium]
MKFAIFLTFMLTASFLSAAVGDLPLEDGDIIFQKSMSRQSQAIEAATHSPLTHVGIVFYERGVPYIYEAVQPVKKTKLSDWGRRGENGSFVVRRLKDKSNIDMDRLKSEVMTYLGRDYDALFGWSDSTIYCSELVWKAYDRACGVQIGDLRKLKDFDLSHPVVQKTLRQRYGSCIPFDMDVISPADIFQSGLLFTVVAK